MLLVDSIKLGFDLVSVGDDSVTRFHVRIWVGTHQTRMNLQTQVANFNAIPQGPWAQ